MQNILTIDLEDWYHGNFLFDQDENIYQESRVLRPTSRLLEILKETGNKATFFVLGSVAEKFPELIKKIVMDGHEIASHGYHHKLVYRLTQNEFKTDLSRSIGILQQLAGQQIKGYRAPYWSILPNMKWAFDVLSDTGIIYDSSIYPFRTYLYGDNAAPLFEYEIESRNGLIKELPPSVLQLANLRIPFCGGFYFRLLPLVITKWGIKRINEKSTQPVVFYLHPYEIDAKKSKNSKGFKNNFILHVNVKKAEKKLYKILTTFRFSSVSNYLIRK